STRPGLEIVEPQNDAAAGVDELEPSSSKLARKRLDVSLDPQDGRPAFASERERFGRTVDRGDGRSQFGELGRRFAGPALQIQDTLTVKIGECVTHLRR